MMVLSVNTRDMLYRMRTELEIGGSAIPDHLVEVVYNLYNGRKEMQEQLKKQEDKILELSRQLEQQQKPKPKTVKSQAK